MPRQFASATDYFEHDADIGIIGRGGTLEEAFENAAAAMVAVSAGGRAGTQAAGATGEAAIGRRLAGASADGTSANREDVAGVGRETEVQIAFAESDPELALVTWLNLIVAEAAARRLRFSRFHLERTGDAWRGVACGRPWRAGEERGTEVKGATLTMLAVARRDGVWEARCVIDV
jgi:SHS2 domain-containing protein